MRHRFRAVWSGIHAERGAVGVEYALLVALFAVTVIAAVDSLQGSAEDQFAESSADVGVPAEVNGMYGEREAGPVGGGPGVTTPDPGPVSQASIALGGGSATPIGSNKWDASVTITATDADGAPVDALVTLSWSGGKTGEAIDLPTGPDGIATQTVESVGHNKDLTFTIVSVAADGYTFVVTNPSVTLQLPAE